ncbi:MAG: hypothetical protein HOQ04_05105 [Pseudarthrobacter sp.]|nr:hypothetical protein [Pseudarthrobacter sp.]
MADTTTALALLVLGVALSLLGRGLLDQWAVSASRHQEPSVDALLGLAAAASGAALLLWWITSLMSAAAGILLEHRGHRRAAEAARRLSPVFMQRLAIAALSLQRGSGVAAHAAVTIPGPEWAPTAVQSSAAPSDPATVPPAEHGQAGSMHQPVPASGPGRVPGSGSASTEGAAVDTGAQAPASLLTPGWQPVTLAVEPGPLAAQQTRPDPGAGSRVPAATVTVLAGDTLWDIVAAHLGPEASDVQIALEWPRWYEANRGLIGPSPDVLLPGQVLVAPAPA